MSPEMKKPRNRIGQTPGLTIVVRDRQNKTVGVIFEKSNVFTPLLSYDLV